MRWLRALRRRWHRRYGHGKPLVHEYETGCLICTRYKYAMQHFGIFPAYCPVCDKHYDWVVPEIAAAPMKEREKLAEAFFEGEGD